MGTSLLRRRKFACLQSLAFPFNLTCLAAKAKWRGESAGKGWCSTSVKCLGHNVQEPTSMHITSTVVFIPYRWRLRYRISFLEFTPCTVIFGNLYSGHIPVARAFVNLFFWFWWSKDRPGVVVNAGHTPFSQLIAANMLA